MQEPYELLQAIANEASDEEGVVNPSELYRVFFNYLDKYKKESQE